PARAGGARHAGDGGRQDQALPVDGGAARGARAFPELSRAPGGGPRCGVTPPGPAGRTPRAPCQSSCVPSNFQLQAVDPEVPFRLNRAWLSFWRNVRLARIEAFLKLGKQQGCSDVHLAVRLPPILRMPGGPAPI